MSVEFDDKFLSKECTVLEDIVHVLARPEEHGLDSNQLFSLLNTSISKPGVSTKMVDFQNLVGLGQQLADTRNVSNGNDNESYIEVIGDLHNTIATHVYINHISLNNSYDNTSIKSNPYESKDYFPDLRLVIKNVLVLLISFLKRYKQQCEQTQELQVELLDSLKQLILLINVSIITKLFNLFTACNPEFHIKAMDNLSSVLL